MPERIHDSAGKSNNPIKTTLSAKQQKAHPVKTPQSQFPDPKFNSNLSKIPRSCFHRPSQFFPRINRKLNNRKFPNIAAPDPFLKTPPVQSKIKVSIPSPSRLQRINNPNFANQSKGRFIKHNGRQAGLHPKLTIRQPRNKYQQQEVQAKLFVSSLHSTHVSQQKHFTNQIQRQCGVDQSCPDEMQESSPWDETKQTVSPTGGIDASGKISVGGSKTRENTFDIDRDTQMSNSSGYNAGVSFNPNEGQVGVSGGYSQSNQIGDQKNTNSATGSGYLDFNSRGELEGGGAGVGVSLQGTSVSLGGGIIVSAQPPILDTDGRYIVTWKREYTGNIGGGYTNSSGRGGNVSYTGKKAITGSRKFDTEPKAKAFYEKRIWASLEPGDTNQLKAEDTISKTDSDRLTGGGSAQVMGLTVGANLTVGGSRSVEITGLGNQLISVKVVDENILGGGLSLGAPGMSMTGGLESSSSKGYIVTFDLNTSSGKSAFQFLTIMGKLPPGGRGYTLRADIKGSKSEESLGVSLIGGSLTNKNTTSETTTTYQNGRTVEERTGTQSSGLEILGLGSFKDEDELKAIDDSQAKNRTYSVTSKTSSTSTEAVNKELAQSTGGKFGRVSKELANQKSRQWTVTSIFSHSQIERLVKEIRRGNWNHHSLIYQAGKGEDFADEVKASGNDWDRIDRALSEFISETGDKGLRLIRETLGINPQYSLTLKGDPYMTGEAGHTALAQKIETWTSHLKQQKSPRKVGLEIATELRKQRKRLTEISDPEKYPDLPHKLRGEEVRRTQKEISKLESLQNDARSLIPNSNKSDLFVDSSLEPTNNSSQMTDKQLVNQEWKTVNSFEERVTAKRSKCVQMGNKARRAHWIHMGAYAFSRSAYTTWGESHWYGDDDHANEYKRAKYAMNTANRLWKKAEELWGNYQEQKTQLEFSKSSEIVGSVESTLGNQLVNIINKFGSAYSWYRIALEKYDAIREAHPEGRNNQFQGYTQGRQLPEEQRLQ